MFSIFTILHGMSSVRYLLCIKRKAGLDAVPVAVRLLILAPKNRGMVLYYTVYRMLTIYKSEMYALFRGACILLLLMDMRD